MISEALGMRILPSCLCSNYAEMLNINSVFLLKPWHNDVFGLVIVSVNSNAPCC